MEANFIMIIKCMKQILVLNNMVKKIQKIEHHYVQFRL